MYRLLFLTLFASFTPFDLNCICAKDTDGTRNDHAARVEHEAAAARDTATEKPVPNVVAGRLVSNDDQPIAGAEVYLFLLGKEELDRKLLARKPSSANGSFRFDHVIDEKEISPERKVSPDEQSRNSVEVVIRSAGYSSRSFALATKDVARQGIFHICEMEPACKFTGRVTGSDGKPVKDARVRMEDAVLSSRWKEINSARTDAEGKFEIDDLMASQTEQSSRIPRHVVKLAGRYGSEICIQQPSLLVEHPDFAARHVYVDTMPGNVDVQLKLPAILEGRVVFNGTGKPVANARIQATTVIDISPRANSFVAKSSDVSTTTDNGGNYRFAALPASRYELWANVPNWTCGNRRDPSSCQQDNSRSGSQGCKGGHSATPAGREEVGQTDFPGGECKGFVLPGSDRFGQRRSCEHALYGCHRRGKNGASRVSREE